jgi:hypothetical protein
MAVPVAAMRRGQRMSVTGGVESHSFPAEYGHQIYYLMARMNVMNP